MPESGAGQGTAEVFVYVSDSSKETLEAASKAVKPLRQFESLQSQVSFLLYSPGTDRKNLVGLEISKLKSHWPRAC